MNSIELSIMTVLIVITLAWFVGTLTRGLSMAYWWQTKEYRRDRMRVHLRTPEGRQLTRSWREYAKLGFGLGVPVLLFVTFFVISQLGTAIWERIGIYVEIVILLAAVVIAYVFVLEAISTLSAMQARRLFRPKWTMRAIVAFGLPLAAFLLYGVFPLAFALIPASTWQGLGAGSAWLTLFSLLYAPLSIVTFLLGSFLFGYVAFLALLSSLVPILSQLGVWFTWPLSLWQEQRTLHVAKSHVAAYPALRTVGITGSYGKTSTKEFLSTLLGQQFKVAKTPENNNTAIGLARAVLRGVSPETEYFIGEYGAYRIGEIKAMTEVLRPQIAVVTAVSHQHLDLFRTLENTIKAKYELVQALPPEGIAIFNADNENVRAMAKDFAGEKRFYSQKGRIQVSGERCAYLAMDIKVTPKQLSFTLVDNRTEPAAKQEIRLDLRGEQHVGSFLAAAAVASELGLPLQAIAEAAQVIQPIPGNMNPLEGRDGLNLIDDSYSANPEGFIAALDYLSRIKVGRKIVVARSMQELGTEATAAHRRVGEKLAKVADWFVLLDRNQENAYRAGIGQNTKAKTRVTVALTPAAAITFLQSEARAGDTILLEGRMPERIIHSLRID